MAKYNTKKVAAKPTEVNAMGEVAWKYDAVEELISTVLTTFVQDSYYEKESKVVKRIKDCVEKVDPLFVAKLAIYARTTGNMRSSSHLLAALIANKISGLDWSKRFYKRVVNRPDDMSEILACYANLKGESATHVRKIHNAIRKGFKAYLEGMDPYLINKYKMSNRDISLIDLVRLFRPKATQKNQEAFNALINGDNKKLDSLVESKSLLKEMSKAGSEGKAEALKTVVTQNPKGASYMELLRNLRNILTTDISIVDDVVSQLTNVKKVLGSKQLPFRFATAYTEIEKVNYSDLKIESGNTSDIKFESDKPKITYDQFNLAKTKLLKAIETALEISCQNIPELEGRTAILIDHSGSVRGDAGGSSKVSAFSKVTTAMIGNLFGSMIASRSKDVYIGLFGDKLIPVEIERDRDGKLKGGLLNFNKRSFDLGARCGGSTETGIYEFFRKSIESKLKIDNVIVFSDCQIGDGGSTSWYGLSSKDKSNEFQNLFREFKKLNPMMNFVEVNIKSTGGNSVFNPKDRILNISGWSTEIFTILQSNLRGFKAMIEEINAIEI